MTGNRTREWKVIPQKPGLDPHAIFDDCASAQYNYLVDRLIKIKFATNALISFLTTDIL
jgi:hypothetical protein